MDSKTKIPEILKEYKSQSWQIEMLIAGGVLFSLYNFGDVLRDFYLGIESTIHLSSHFMVGFFGAYVLTTVLLIGFGANLILRAIWLAYLGISYAFSDGINFDNVRGNTSFKQSLKSKPTALERVAILEKWSKLSFSFAILVALFVVSLVITVAATIWVLNGLWFGLGDTPEVTYTVVFIMGIIQLGILDQLFISKKNSGLRSRLYNGLSRLFGILTLSFIYRREALVLKSNVNRWMLYIFAILYLSIAIMTSVNRVGEFYSSGTFRVNLFDDRDFYKMPFRTYLNAMRYESNLRPGNKVQYGSIQSDIIKDDYLKLFVVYREQFDWQLEDTFEKYPVATAFPDSLEVKKDRTDFAKQQTKNFLRAINDFLKIEIDSTPYEDLLWYTYKNPITEEEGYITYIKIDSLSKDAHKLEITVRYDSQSRGSVKETWLRIPFWKE